MQVTLGINTGFAINRFPEPDDWIGVVADELGLDTVQFTADLLNPFLPAEVVARGVETIAGLCARKGVRVQTTFTSAFTRVNHLMHPDLAVQRVWVDWFRRFFTLSRDLGAEGAGSHFGIMSVRDNADAAVRERRVNQAVEAWRELSEFGAGIGLKYLLFEPMSVPREVAETISATEDILRRCADGFAVPMRLCLDVDHGDLQSADPRDTDPHAWIRAFGAVSPCIHIKQSLRDKGGHYPFTAKYNAQGKVVPEEILGTMRGAGIEECTLLLEISHRERWPADYTVVSDLKESVEYWRPAVEKANRGEF
ncbi:MAG: sugar phosphate isomerase/epimerase [Candidatus Hydrogenedentes bacterium]|nr:sugar phosphate isomerase/epimerase [Candidatus Hydrogenedentota bacterium]